MLLLLDDLSEMRYIFRAYSACPGSSIGQSTCLRSRWLQIRVLPGAHRLIFSDQPFFTPIRLHSVIFENDVQ